MSIAVTAVIRPSLRISIATHILCIVILLAGIAVGYGAMGSFSPSGRILIAAISIPASFLAIILFRRREFPVRLEILDSGEIWLARMETNSDKMDFGRQRVELTGDTTLWPNLMILRLRAEDGRVLVVRVLPDTVSAQEYRALSVALRWIAMRDAEAGGTALHSLTMGKTGKHGQHTGS